ncbi:MAG: molecular chaperone GrpE [Candidatus Saganbacteria bacterium]|uniref:Protein GrpE n=1 Tax=Candidatus Saganbacteria bacterium TaxID=2575572 RepID=A0A833L120_UNCSA|nr:MAG: molecular chaperone GrpE [Candidatus Saganbacteria bacterium]
MPEEIKETAKELPKEKTEEELFKEALEDQKNKLLRALADFDNYKKRVAIEQDQFVQFANEGIIRDLLPVLDGLDKALESAETSKTNENLVKGIALVKRQMLDAFKKIGVIEIESIGKPYDANIHEAIMKKKSNEPENVIIEEMQKGYTLNGRVIRPSMVIVSKKGE